MGKRVVLLTPTEEWVGLRARVVAVAADVDVRHARTLDQLKSEATNLAPGDRVISFATPVIVPGEVLDTLPGPAYNFHNGPPAYPGLFPACFALYDGATAFGATVHEMTAELDQGPITGVEMCDMPENIDRFHLEALSRQLLDRLLARTLPSLLHSDEDMPHAGIAWAARVTRRRDFEELCTLPNDVDHTEFERRLRSVGEGPFHALRTKIHGRWFALQPLEESKAVYRGGKKIEN